MCKCTFFLLHNKNIFAILKKVLYLQCQSLLKYRQLICPTLRKGFFYAQTLTISVA